MAGYKLENSDGLTGYISDSDSEIARKSIDNWTKFWIDYYKQQDKKKWNHCGSALARRIKAGVKDIKN